MIDMDWISIVRDSFFWVLFQRLNRWIWTDLRLNLVSNKQKKTLSFFLSITINNNTILILILIVVVVVVITSTVATITDFVHSGLENHNYHAAIFAESSHSKGNGTRCYA